MGKWAMGMWVMGNKGIVANAVALVRQHRFDFDIAYLSAWYGSGKKEIPKASPNQVAAWMQRVKNVPVVSEAQAERWLQAYADHKCGNVRRTMGWVVNEDGEIVEREGEMDDNE